MHSFCMLTTMERILTTNSSILCLNCNDINNLKSLFLKKVIAINIIVKNKQTYKLECNQVVFGHLHVMTVSTVDCLHPCKLVTHIIIIISSHISLLLMTVPM